MNDDIYTDLSTLYVKRESWGDRLWGIRGKSMRKPLLHMSDWWLNYEGKAQVYPEKYLYSSEESAIQAMLLLQGVHCGWNDHD